MHLFEYKNSCFGFHKSRSHFANDAPEEKCLQKGSAILFLQILIFVTIKAFLKIIYARKPQKY